MVGYGWLYCCAKCFHAFFLAMCFLVLIMPPPQAHRLLMLITPGESSSQINGPRNRQLRGQTFGGNRGNRSDGELGTLNTHH